MRVSKYQIIFASLMILMVIGSAYTQDTAKTKKAPQPQQQQKAAPELQAQKVQTEQVKTSTEAPSASVKGSQPKLKYFVFTEECFNKLSQGQLDVDCIKLTISKTISYGIIGGSLLYKAPQIIKVISAGSVEGLSLSSFYFQLIMTLISIGYNLHLKAHITTYAENISVMVQTAILIILHWKLNPKTSTACVIASTAMFSAIGGVMYLDILPDLIYQGIGITNIVLFILAVTPQIKMNYQNKSTGQLAFITTFMAWAGNMARVFTTSQEVKDPLLMAFFIIGAVLNGIVVLQFFIYKGAAKPKKDEKKKQ